MITAQQARDILQETRKAQEELIENWCQEVLPLIEAAVITSAKENQTITFISCAVTKSPVQLYSPSLYLQRIIDILTSLDYKASYSHQSSKEDKSCYQLEVRI